MLQDNFKNRTKKFGRSLSNSSFKSSAIISLSDLNKIKSSINIFGKENNQIMLPKRNERYDETFLANSIKLKNKIIDYDKNHKNSLSRLNKIDYDKENEKERQVILNKAKREIEEHYDEVKYMNSIMLSAQLASVRDKQMEERNRMGLKNKRIEEKLDLLCEIERLKDINNR